MLQDAGKQAKEPLVWMRHMQILYNPGEGNLGGSIRAKAWHVWNMRSTC